MTKLHLKRTEALLHQGVPRYVRCYDNGGRSFDRYTVCFTGRAATLRGPGGWEYLYLGMSDHPFHPQGFGQHGVTKGFHCDCLGGKRGTEYRRPPAVGRKNHLGVRIHFQDLPPDCQKAVLTDYKEIWSL